MPIEKYKNLFRSEYLKIRLQTEGVNVRDQYFEAFDRIMGFEQRAAARADIDGWKEKDYPDTLAENIKIFDDYLNLCEENNSRPIIFLPPLSEGYIKHFSKKKIDEFRCIVLDAIKKHPSGIFLDGWKIPGFTDNDFHDVSHMNIQGSTKFSAMLNNFIESL